MPPAKGKGRGAGASGSRSQSLRPTAGATTRSRSAHREPSQVRAGSRMAEKSGDDGSSSKKQKRTNSSTQENAAAGSASVAAGEEETAAAPSSPKKAAAASASAAARQEESAAAPSIQENAASASASAAASQEEEADASAASDVSSPMRRPYMVMEPWDEANILAYHEETAKYQAKCDRQNKLLSLDLRGSTTCLDDDESLAPVRESITQMVFQTAKNVLGLTSFIDGKPLKWCSGFLIGWNKETKRGTVLTSANLLCTKTTINDWACPREYAPDAEVQIHLLDNTTQKGTLINYHKHYNIALFEVDINMSTELLPVSPKQLVDYDQEVFLIGRNEDLNLNASYGRVQCTDEGYFAHYHYMYLDGEFSKFSDGGPAVDTQGRIVGMANSVAGATFIPHIFTLKCLRMWKDFKCVPRLHLGLKVKSVKFLRSFHREKMSRKFNIDAGLIVQEVSEGSPAEKIGIRNGDVIESFNGRCIPTVVELEIMLLSTCEHCLENGGVLGSNVDLMVSWYQIRKQKRCTKTLTLSVSDEVEVIAEGRYPVYAAQKNSADMSSRQETCQRTEV